MDIVKRQEIYKAYKGWAPAELTSLAKDTPDPLPFVMRSEEVPFLKSAVAQWGRLLPLVYHDLWGEQSLVKEGVLDADLVWGRLGLDPAFFNGLPAFVELQVELDIPVIAHPAFAGAGRVAPPLLLGKLFRLFGADATIFPNHGGRFGYSRETCLGIASAAQALSLAGRVDAVVVGAAFMRALGEHGGDDAVPRALALAREMTQALATRP